jgi:hypothetical protein
MLIRVDIPGIEKWLFHEIELTEITLQSSVKVLGE